MVYKIVEKMHEKFPMLPFSGSMPHQLHLKHHLLLCNELHDHRQTQANKVRQKK